MKTNKTGRHPLPEMASFLKKVTAWGISNDCQVVVYDDNTGAIAARLWWMLTHIGIDHVAILDGGFSYWQKLGYPVSDVIPAFHQERKPLQSADWQYVTTAQVRHYIEDPQYIIIDARAADRYAGKAEPIDAIAGHIPGALNRFHGLNYDSSGLFKSADELKKEYSALIGNYAPDHVIFYCGSGVTSCANLAAMQLAELPGAKLYLGSWSEWIRDPENPIITLKKN
jgi:thiosulfate/3-mercaptopyruvate sulfurtransferase